MKNEISIKDAIKITFIKTGRIEKGLSAGDLNFLLLQNKILDKSRTKTEQKQWHPNWKPKRYLTKEKKKLYQTWEKQFTAHNTLREMSDQYADEKLLHKTMEKQRYENQWEYPFRRFRCSKQFLDKILQEMVIEISLKKKGQQYFLTRDIVSEAIRKYDVASLEMTPLSSISPRFTINLYGFDFPSLIDTLGEYTDNDSLKRIKKELENLIDNVRTASEDLKHFKLHLIQIVQDSIKRSVIEDKNYSKLDRELALLFCCYYWDYPVYFLPRSFYDALEDRENQVFLLNGRRYVIKPDETLIDLFKKHFYPSKEKEELYAMLKDYQINEMVSNYIRYHQDLLKLYFASKYTIVAHPFQLHDTIWFNGICLPELATFYGSLQNYADPYEEETHDKKRLNKLFLSHQKILHNINKAEISDEDIEKQKGYAINYYKHLL
jgi:hypothetical protein